MRTGECAGCGSQRLEKAVIEGAALRLEASSTLKKVFSVGMVVNTVVCMACGHIGALSADPEALNKALQ